MMRTDGEEFDSILRAVAASPAVSPATATSSDPFGLIGRTIDGRFRVDEQVAEGGFGVVYRAHQLVLGRTIALKVLKTPDGPPDKKVKFYQTFEEEARTLGRLKHPNIVEVYDFGVTETQKGAPLRFMALEWLEGQTLQGVLAGMRGRRMDPAYVLNFLRPALRAIAFAHRQRVAHRDLKPANVFLADIAGSGVLKVLDFGIAKIMAAGREGENAATTMRGIFAFSPNYAAPEQMVRDRTGPWTDVHALGLILTEMLTGEAPYSCSEEDLFATVTSDVRPTPAAKGVAVGRWEPILAKALAKRSGDRYPTADELLDALERCTSGPAPQMRVAALDAVEVVATTLRAGPITAPPSSTEVPAPPKPPQSHRSIVRALAAAATLLVATGAFWMGWPSHQKGPRPERVLMAVLPFENLTGDPQQEYFSDGLTDGMIGQLGRLAPDRLAVIARTSVLQYKGTHKNAREIGRELGVAYLLESTVERSDNRVRVQAHLVQVSDETQVWGDTFDRELKDVLVLQSEVAQAIAKGVRLKLSPDRVAGLSQVPTVTPAAYDAYLRGQYAKTRRTSDSLPRAIGYFERGIKIDPKFAAAHAALAETISLLQFYADARPDDVEPKAKTSALKAVELDDTVAAGHMVLGKTFLIYDWNWPGAASEFRRALELEPNNPDAHRLYGSSYLASVGRPKEAIAETQQTLALDPVSVIGHAMLGRTYYFARRYDEAVTELEGTIDLDGSFLYTHTVLGWVRAARGEFDKALDEVQKAGNVSSETLALKGYALARAGRSAEALAQIEQLRARGRAGYVSAQWIARVYAGLGQKDEALDWLEKAYGERSLWLTFLRVEPIWDPLRGDPRFVALVRRIGIPESG